MSRRVSLNRFQVFKFQSTKLLWSCFKAAMPALYIISADWGKEHRVAKRTATGHEDHYMSILGSQLRFIVQAAGCWVFILGIFF